MEPDYEIMGETLIVNVPQELDHHSAKMVKEYSDQIIRDKSIKNIVFDFSNSTFMDSSGIGMIMGRYRVVKEKKGFVGVKGVGLQFTEYWKYQDCTS